MEASAMVLGRPHAFERGDKLYLTTPITLATPTAGEIEEFAFASAVKSQAPNENIGWLRGRYVEAGKPNLNKAMWLTDELALKSLTPMLMPITVMHDPRTSVGVIADTKLIEEGGCRIDNILAIWKHRYPETWEEAQHNVEKGSLAQSMECYAPWYTCSTCDQQFVKLPNGAEQGSWCDHLRANSGWRILRDVCFTGTGLIFGSRGGQPAYTQATLDYMHDEIAAAHDQAHHDSTYRPSQRSAQMGLVQIEESELATLRTERNEARTRVDAQANELRTLTTKVETAEAAQKKAEDEKTASDKRITDLETASQQAQLKDKRIGALGTGFMAKLGNTSKTVLNDLAAKASDDEWERAVAEREELAGVKRDAKADANPGNGSGGGGGGEGSGSGSGSGDSGAQTFRDEEVASFMRTGGGAPASTTAPVSGATAVRQLARSFAKGRAGSGSGSGSGNGNGNGK